jgi:hypothetical protein
VLSVSSTQARGHQRQAQGAVVLELDVGQKEEALQQVIFVRIHYSKLLLIKPEANI